VTNYLKSYGLIADAKQQPSSPLPHTPTERAWSCLIGCRLFSVDKSSKAK